jgi:hypothetical protein
VPSQVCCRWVGGLARWCSRHTASCSLTQRKQMLAGVEGEDRTVLLNWLGVASVMSCMDCYDDGGCCAEPVGNEHGLQLL